MTEEIKKRFENPKQQKLYELLTKRNRYINEFLSKLRGSFSKTPEGKRVDRMYPKAQHVFTEEEKKIFQELKNVIYGTDDQQKEESTVKDGERDGFCRFYDVNGNLEEESYFKEGKREGVCNRYYPNGQLEEESIYVDDMRNGLCKFYNEEGWLEDESMFKNDALNGSSKLYYSNGEIKEESVFKNDVMLWKL